MKLPFKITKSIVVVNTGTDKALLSTDLPPAVFPFKESPTLKLDVAKGKGEEYVRHNLEGDIEISKILLLVTGATDKVVLFTNLPPTVYPYTERASLTFEVAKGMGADYIREHFGLESPGNAMEEAASTMVEYEVKDVSA